MKYSIRRSSKNTSVRVVRPHYLKTGNPVRCCGKILGNLKLGFVSSGIWTFQYRKLFSVSIFFNLELLGVLLDLFISRCAVDLYSGIDILVQSKFRKR